MHPKTSALYASTSAPNHMPFSWPFGTQRLIPQSHLVDSLFSHLVTQVIYTFPFNIDFSVHSVSLYLNHLAPGCSFIQHLFDSYHTRQIYAASCFEVPLLSYFLSLQSCLTRHLFLSYSYTGLLHNNPTRPFISSLLILISLCDPYGFQASFGLFLYRNLLPSFKLIDVMPPRPSNLNCYKTLSIWYAIYTTSTSILRCLLGHLLHYNSWRLLLGSLFPYHFH